MGERALGYWTPSWGLQRERFAKRQQVASIWPLAAITTGAAACSCCYSRKRCCGGCIDAAAMPHRAAMLLLLLLLKLDVLLAAAASVAPCSAAAAATPTCNSYCRMHPAACMTYLDWCAHARHTRAEANGVAKRPRAAADALVRAGGQLTTDRTPADLVNRACNPTAPQERRQLVVCRLQQSQLPHFVSRDQGWLVETAQLGYPQDCIACSPTSCITGDLSWAAAATALPTWPHPFSPLCSSASHSSPTAPPTHPARPAPAARSTAATEAGARAARASVW